jgi:single-strand DNA-binding protein
MNRVILVGRIASDPELRYTPSGVPVANFRLAVNRDRPSQQGEREADFFTVVAWRQSAEFAANYLSKGRLVAVDGRLQARQWTTQDGQKRSMVEVVADRLEGLDRPREGAPAAEAKPAEERPRAAAEGPSEATEEYDPFAEQ